MGSHQYIHLEAIDQVRPGSLFVLVNWTLAIIHLNVKEGIYLRRLGNCVPGD